MHVRTHARTHTHNSRCRDPHSTSWAGCTRACPCSQVRDRLAATRAHMEDLLAGREPSRPEGASSWYESEDEIAEPLMACYWWVLVQDRGGVGAG